MSDGMENVHIVFGQSIADTLRNAMMLLGKQERVIGLPDLLSVGPIDPPEPNIRRAWARAVLCTDNGLQDALEEDRIDVTAIWLEATTPYIAPVFWACLRSPMEHACFLAFAELMKGRRFDIVDATDIAFTPSDGRRPLRSLGQMREQDIVATNLYAMQRTISSDELREASSAWSRLRRENAPFRIVTGGRLVSAPLTHYDAVLIEHAGQDWEIAARLIGRVVVGLCEDRSVGQATSDFVLFGRMLMLGREGALDVEGPGPSMRDYRVRRCST